MANPKFIPIENKVLINARLPKQLTDKLEKYSELTGNTKTDIFTLALAKYFENITIDNTYLPDKSGVAIKIPVAPNQKDYCIDNKLDLSTLINTKRLNYDVFHSETFEILMIPNNLDVFDGETYKTTGISYSYDIDDYGVVDINVIHSGIEFFIHDSYETLIKTKNITVFDMLYCFYFEIYDNGKLSIKLIDYVTAINYLSDANNDIAKNLLISCYNELNTINKMEIIRDEEIESTFEEKNNYYNNPYADPELNVDEEILYADVEKKIHEKHDFLIDDELFAVACKYNTGNIIKLGDGIAERMQKPENYVSIYSNILKSVYDADDEIYKELLKDAISNEIKNEKHTKFDKIEFE